MAAPRKPLRWQGSDNALRAVQVAFDVEEAVMEAVRVAAFEANVSTSTQIRDVLGLPVPAERPKRPRLTVTLSGDDYALLAERFGFLASAGSDFHRRGDHSGGILGACPDLPPQCKPVWAHFGQARIQA